MLIPTLTILRPFNNFDSCTRVAKYKLSTQSNTTLKEVCPNTFFWLNLLHLLTQLVKADVAFRSLFTRCTAL